MRFTLVFRVSSLVLWSSLAGAVSALTYHVTDLGFLPGDDISRGIAVNSSGRVTGTSRNQGTLDRAFLSGPDGGPINPLGTLPGAAHSGSYGYALNDAGQVAGLAFTPSGTFHAFVSGANGGTLKDLGTLPGLGENGYSQAHGVNDAGQVTGYSTVAPKNGTYPEHAFLSEPNGGALKDLGTLFGGYSVGLAVNASGQVAGTWDGRAFLSGPNGGPLKNLGTLTADSTSEGFAVNSLGQVAGRSYSVSTGMRAFVSGPDGGALTDLGDLGGRESSAFGINEQGWVVGESKLANGVLHAFLYTATSGLVDLNTMLDYSGGGLTLIRAEGISGTRYIAATAIMNGKFHAVLLDANPVPEPSVLASLGLGLLVLIRRRRR